jgi:hypothetical protein
MAGRRSGRTWYMLRAALAHVRSNASHTIVVHTNASDVARSLAELGATAEEMARIRIVTTLGQFREVSLGVEATVFVDHLLHETDAARPFFDAASAWPGLWRDYRAATRLHRK